MEQALTVSCTTIEPRLEMEFSTTQISSIQTESIALWKGPTSSMGEVVIQITLWCLCVFTILGNLLVIIVFIRDRRLRAKISNLFILNLSLADLLVGCISIPFHNVYRHTGVWALGEVTCKFWIIMDFGECFVSVWAIVLISYDRYMLITKGLKYDQLQTFRKFIVLAAFTWMFNMFNFAIPVVGYDIIVETSIDYNVYCDSAVFHKSGFIIYDLIISCLIPVAMIAYFNIRLYRDIKRRSRGMPRNTASIEPEGSTGNTSAATNNDQQSDNSGTIDAPQRQGTTDIRKHRRAAIKLSLIVGVSSLCWLPYFIITILSITLGVNTSTRALIVSYYIFYSNSAINPLLYVATNPRIRNGMVKLIKMPFAGAANYF